jgi:hypothetical protein
VFEDNESCGKKMKPRKEKGSTRRYGLPFYGVIRVDITDSETGEKI